MHRIYLFFAMLAVSACVAVTDYNNFGGEYLGAKYVNDPLGEGAGYDADPLIRTDAFDCQTYIETALSCGNVDRLTQIRYNGSVDFTHRNHFFSADWIPNNSDIVKNISAQFGRPTLRRGVIDKAAWFRTVHHMDVDAAPVNAEIEYVPYANINTDDISAPVLVAFVVDNPKTRAKIGTDILVSHVGFLLPNGTLRHASSAAGRVTDTDFKEYAHLRAADSANLGVAFFEIREVCK